MNYPRLTKLNYHYLVSGKNNFHRFIIDEAVGLWDEKNVPAPPASPGAHYMDCAYDWDMRLAMKTHDGPRQRRFFDGGYTTARQTHFGLHGYWWCRCGDWLPVWGKLIETKCALMEDIKRYWRNRFAKEQYNKAIILYQWNTQLPVEVINGILWKVLYPYQGYRGKGGFPNA
jgi:hypothetical protein